MTHTIAENKKAPAYAGAFSWPVQMIAALSQDAAIARVAKKVVEATVRMIDEAT